MRADVILRWLTGACALVLLVLSAGCAPPPPPGRGTPPAMSGALLDLRDWDFEREGAVHLDGPWDLVWRRFEPPDHIGTPAAARGLPVPVPGGWNEVEHEGRPIGGLGFGTYRLVVDCHQARALALALPVQHSALRLYVNGRLVARQGTPASSPERAQPEQRRQIVVLDDLRCPLRLVAHVSNYDARRGGLMRSIVLGPRDLLHAQREAAIARDLFAMGVLLVMGAAPVLFWAGRRQDRSPLWFGLFCLASGWGLGLTGTRVLESLAAPWGWDAYLRVLMLLWFGALVAFVLFLGALYRPLAPRWAARVALAWGAAAALVLLLMPASIFTLVLVPVLQGGAILIAVYTVLLLGLALRRGDRSAGLLLAGVAVLGGAMLHDTLQFAHLQQQSLLPWGWIGFAAAPAILLARRFARALSAEELRSIEQSSKADLLVRATNAGLFDWDVPRGRIEYSDRFREMLGLVTAADWRVPFYALVHPEDRARVSEHFDAQVRDRGVRSGVRALAPLECRLRHADGHALWAQSEGIAVCGDDGRPLRFICSFIDVSERKQHEIEMSDRVKFIDDLFDSVPIGLALRDPEGTYLYVNRTWEREIGLPRERVVGSSLRQLDDPAAVATLALDQEALALGPGATMAPREFDDQGRRYVQTRTVMVDSADRRIGVLVASLDITEKYQMETALALERERLALLVRSTRAGFGDWDAVKDRVVYSDRFKEMLGYPVDFDTAQWPSIFEMMHPEDAPRAREEFRALIRRQAGVADGAPAEPMSYRLRRRDGSFLWIHAEGISQRDQRGRTVRFITSYLDVTKFHEQEEALRVSRDQIAAQAQLLERQNEALKENVRLREEVERIGRHDLKTPLNSIIAVPRLLREERSLGPEAEELLGVVERAGYRILSMVNLSLDLYKMEQGSYIFRPDAVDLEDLARKVITDLRLHAASKQVTIDLRSDAAPYAWAEELLCYSLLANLLKNAVEASPEGATVQVRIGAVEGGGVALRIRNQGAVPASIRANFFQKYATAGKASGTGLGAYSAHLMASVQDGQVRMDSSEEDGTILTVELRQAPPGQVPATLRHAAERRERSAQATLASLPPLRVLLVDDDEYNLLIVRRFLPTPPLTVDTAINGRVALAQAERHWPQLVFMDLDMPVMGGLEAVARLRDLERARGGPRCQMVALSSHEDEATARRALAAGFDRYLTKPVTRESIQQVLLELLAPSPAGAVAPTTERLEAATAQESVVVLEAALESILPGFMASRRTLLAQLAAAVARGERTELRRLAHQLSGSFALYGFRWAAERSRWLEQHFEAVSMDEAARLARSLLVHLETVDIRFQAEDAAEEP